MSPFRSLDPSFGHACTLQLQISSTRRLSCRFQLKLCCCYQLRRDYHAKFKLAIAYAMLTCHNCYSCDHSNASSSIGRWPNPSFILTSRNFGPSLLITILTSEGYSLRLGNWPSGPNSEYTDARQRLQTGARVNSPITFFCSNLRNEFRWCRIQADEGPGLSVGCQLVDRKLLLTTRIYDNHWWRRRKFIPSRTRVEWQILYKMILFLYLSMQFSTHQGLVCRICEVCSLLLRFFAHSGFAGSELLL